MTSTIESFLSQYPTVHALVEQNRVVWDRMYDNSFVAAVVASTLEPERFRFFTSQDVLYLKEFARVYALGAAQTTSPDVLRHCAEHLLEVVNDEIPMNERLHAGIDPLCSRLEDPEQRSTMAAVTQGYASWLFSTCFGGGVETTVIATLPCSLSYGFIGIEQYSDTIDNDVYREWLSFFYSDAYRETMHYAAEAAEQALASKSAAERDALSQIFANACRWETEFWDMAAAEKFWK